jgi:pRiA4b ORF-3-like protein
MPRTSGPAAKSLVRQVMQEADAPLTIDEILMRVTALHPLSSGNPKTTVRNAIGADPLVQLDASGHYTYLPRALSGAHMRVSMELAAPARGLLGVTTEVFSLLWPAGFPPDPAERTLLLQDGPSVTLLAANVEGAPRRSLYALLALPLPFWAWWAAQRSAGSDALLIRCEDGEALRFSVQGLDLATLDRDSVAACGAALRECTEAVLKTVRGIEAADLAVRLLARGIYHADPPPEPLDVALFAQPRQLFMQNGMIVRRPNLSPALQRLFAPRLLLEEVLQANAIRGALDLPLLPEPEEPGEVEWPAVASRAYRLKVSLAWDTTIWRVIEILDNQSLEDLHDAIQDAFRWDDDHLYAFFLSGERWDSLTEVQRPTEFVEEPPTADEVPLAALDLQPGRRLFYLFDFGDELGHYVDVVESFTPSSRAKYPRIVARHGKAPPQYPAWDEDGDEP